MTAPPRRAAGPRARARARHAATPVATGHSSGQNLAALLRQLRGEYGLSVSRLAERAGVARSTVQRLERGQLRPRPSTLEWLAGAIDPGGRAEILARLVAAAGDEIVPPDEAWARYQMHRMDDRLQSGRAPLPLAWERRILLTAAAEAMWQASDVFLDSATAAFRRLETGQTADLLELVEELREESERLSADAKDAGGQVDGLPKERRRGDPQDVSPHAPPLADAAAVRRWVREWQVREGRLQPRSARERAVALTGVRERQAIKDAPPPPPDRRAEDMAIHENELPRVTRRSISEGSTVSRRRMPSLVETGAEQPED